MVISKDMAKDVNNALIEVIEKEGKMTREAAEEYLNHIAKARALPT